MIHLFNKKKKLLWFPVAFANSVAAWCLGVCSPKGTISIKNTATPKEGGSSLQLDINEDKVASMIASQILKKAELTEVERKLIKALICGLVDQKYITYRNDLIGLDVDRLKSAIISDAGVGKPAFRPFDGTPATFTSRVKLEAIPSGAKFARKVDTWKAGNQEGNGARFLAISREEVDDEDDPAEHYLFLREVLLNSAGEVLSIGEELNGCIKILA